MKKRKILNLICCFALVLCSTLMFAACGFTNPTPGYESGSGAPEPDEGTKPPSSGDDSEIEIDDEGGVAGGEIADFSDYFNGYVVLSNGDSTFKVYDEVTKTEVTFNDLLNRQIDVLAQDLIYRLTYVYGSIRTNETDIGNSFNLVNKDGSNYTYQDKAAIFDSKKTLINNIDHTHTSGEIDLNCLSCIQNSLNNESGFSNYLFYETMIHLPKAIEGYYTTLNLISLNNKVAANPWNWTVENATYENYLTKFKNNLKMAIAYILSDNDEYKNIDVNYSFNEEMYNNTLSKIDTLGLFNNRNENSQKLKLETFVLNNIIGASLIEKDENIYNCTYLKNNNYVITSNFQLDAPYDDPDDKFTEDEIANSPRLYKGYAKIIPAIVDQVFTNTFQNTEISLYPTFARVNGDIGTFDTYEITNPDGEVVQEMTTTGPLDLNSIILMPKQGSKPIALNLQVAVARDLKTGNTPSSAGINDLSCFAHDVVVELEVNITYKVHGQDEPVFSQVIQPDGEDGSTLTIDSKGYVPTYIDYEDPNFDPTRVDEEGYLDQFKKPMDTNGEILPYTYIFSIYDYFPDDMPAFNDYDGYNPVTDTNTLFNNKFQKSEDSVYLDAGPDYVQFTFNIKSIKQYSGDGNQLVDYSGDDIVFDIALMPYTF